MSKALHINAAERTISEVEFEGIRDLQKLVGGFLEVARTWPYGGDTLFVDEEGLLKKPPLHWFGFAGRVYVGNGVVVGREIEGEEYPQGYINADPVLTISELQTLVTFSISERNPSYVD
jgi:hypothetical protein